jgi:TatD DNase family protein
MRPHLPWLVHGFRGNSEMAMQLISRGMYLSFWFSFVMRPESAVLLKAMPANRIFLETDGAETDIRDLYRKAAGDLGLPEEELRLVIQENYRKLFIREK